LRCAEVHGNGRPMALKQAALRLSVAALSLLAVCVLLASSRQESEATELKAVIVANTAVKQRLWSLSDYLDIPSKAAAAGVNEQPPKWGYAKGEEWADESHLWGECSAGQQQSPVNVRRGYWTAFWGSAWAKRYLKSKRADTGPLIWHVAPPAARELGKRAGLVFHKGVAFNQRSITVPFKAAPEGALIQATGPDGNTYALDLMRVHTPSEHTFDGIKYAMEIQFEHSGMLNGEKTYMVVSVFLHEGAESPRFVRKIADAARAALDSDEDGSGVVEGLEVEEVPFAAIAQSVLMQTEMPLEISGHIRHEDKSPHPKASYRGREFYADQDASIPNYKAYYYYHGSRTAPPCEQNFRWVLLKHSMEVSSEDVAAMTKLTGSNARTTQKLNGRLIVDSNPF